jgi:hypothetical protein
MDIENSISKQQASKELTRDANNDVILRPQINSTTLQNSKLIDPIALELQAKYRADGLTFVSNNESIVPRTEAGNIQLTENAEDNPLLIIDPVAERVTTKSILRVLDTRFQYYTFPVTVTTTTTDEIDTEIAVTELDTIYARYKPSENRRVSAESIYSGILMDEIEDGNSQKNISSYYITKEIKNSGKDLRFRIKLQHRYDNTANTIGTIYFSLMKSGPDYDLVRNWDEFGGGEIGQYEIQTDYYDEIILNSQFEIGDNFVIGAVAGQNSEFDYHTINSEQSYWVITDASKNVDEWNQPVE